MPERILLFVAVVDAMLNDRYDLMLQVAQKAGEIAHGYFERRATLTIQKKGVQDLLSEADQEVEKHIRSAIAAKFPGDSFLGEESGGAQGDSLWVVDPIDGTTNFLRGTPYYAVAMAYVKDGVTELGAIYAPELRLLYSARRGRGASCNGRPLRVTDTSELTNAVFGVGYSHKTAASEFGARVHELLGKKALLRWHGSAALMLCDVASGQTDGCFEAVLSSWDALAGMLLVREAGGRASPEKDTWLKAPVIAANQQLFGTLSELLQLR